MPLVPARYIGDYPVVLASHGRYVDASGTPLASNLLNPGDTVQLPDYEVLGYTHKYEARRVGSPENLGIGRVILPEDQSLSDEQLFEAGYEFIVGRPDFMPLPSPESKRAAAKPPKEE